MAERMNEFFEKAAWRYRCAGRAEGQLEGLRNTVVEQLTLRFGAMPVMAEVRIRSAAYEELERLAEELLTARSLAEAILAMAPAEYPYRSEFARRYFGEGKVQGEAQGRAAILLKQLDLRFGPLPIAVRVRIEGSRSEELEAIAARVLTAQTLQEVVP